MKTLSAFLFISAAFYIAVGIWMLYISDDFAGKETESVKKHSLPPKIMTAAGIVFAIAGTAALFLSR